jgi:RNA polymerase sigma-70 factor (ECF subfamily)
MSREESVKLYNTYARKLFNISFRILHDSGEAEEIMQDTILKYITTGPKILSEVQAAAWLSKTCIRKSIDVLRKKKREKLFLEEYGSEVEDAFDAKPGDLSIGNIRKAISELPEASRLVLTLILLEGLDYEEVANYTGAREGTIRVQYSRARAKLAEKLRSM